MRNKSFLLIIIVVSIIFSMGGCGKGKKTVGISLLTRQHVFYRQMESSFRETAEAKGIEVIIKAAEFDVASQVAQVKQFIADKVDALIIAPVDSELLGDAIKAAGRAGIPVFTVDISFKKGDIVSHIASDNELGGRLAAEYMVKYLKGKGEIIIIDHPIVDSVQMRVKGFEEEIKKYPAIEIVDKPRGDGQRDRVEIITANMLNAYPGLDGIFAINDDTALGALSVIEEAGWDDIIILGYDAVPEAREAILAGTALKADVIQYPDKIGRIAIETVIKYWDKESIPKYIPVEVGIVDKKVLDKQ